MNNLITWIQLEPVKRQYRLFKVFQDPSYLQVAL